jgi:hypothetical protein
MQLKNTKSASVGAINILTYGAAGAGKTTLISTLPNPVILSAEAGLLSLSGKDIPYIEISNLAELQDAYKWLTSSNEAKSIESVALDSLSEVAEIVLVGCKKAAKDPRQAYGEMQESVVGIIRAFRNLDKIFYASAKLERTQDEMGRLLYSPSMPGQKLGQQIPYLFDFVLPLRAEKAEDGTVSRYLSTQPDGLWQAKSRVGALLAPIEPADLSGIIKKIKGNSNV